MSVYMETSSSLVSGVDQATQRESSGMMSVMISLKGDDVIEELFTGKLFAPSSADHPLSVQQHQQQLWFFFAQGHV